MGLATDQVTLALLRTSSRFRLTGAGIADVGLHEFLGPASGTAGNTAGVLGIDHQMVRQKTDLTVSPGGDIVVEQMIDVETPTAGTAVFGVLYE